MINLEEERAEDGIPDPETGKTICNSAEGGGCDIANDITRNLSNMSIVSLNPSLCTLEHCVLEVNMHMLICSKCKRSTHCMYLFATLPNLSLHKERLLTLCLRRLCWLHTGRKLHTTSRCNFRED